MAVDGLEADALALEAQIELVKYDREHVFGKYALTSDASIALESYLKELEVQYSLLQDTIFSRSLDHALSTDQDILTQFEAVNIQERNDHELAVRLSGGYSTRLGSVGRVESAEGPSSSEANVSPGHIGYPTKECSSCYEQVPCVNSGKCKHSYCFDCMKGLYEACLSDRSLIPARCCKEPFPYNWAKTYLNGQNLVRYNLFLKEGSIAKMDASRLLDKEYNQIVSALGGKQCSKCGIGITKKDGCNHMTCHICRHEFCYVCGANWIPQRECKCDLFSQQEIENMLDEHPVARNDLIAREQLRQVLLANEHRHHWVRHIITNRNKRCKNGCDWVCNKWFYQCSTCNLNSCGRCIRNR